MATPAHVTAATITCRKCRAQGIQNFKRAPVYLETGLCLDVISCLICSDWYASKPVTATVREEDGAAMLPEICAAPGCSRTISESRANAGATLCSRCEHHGKNLALQAPREPSSRRKYATLACTVAGCHREIAPWNKTGLCSSCYSGLKKFNAYVGKNKGLPPIIRTATGYITRAAYVALNPQEVTHVETISELPRLAPPASPAPAVRHQPRRAPLLRRDDHESVALQPLAADWENAPQPAALAQLLSAIGLPVPVEVITCHWQPADRIEAKEFAMAVQRVKRLRNMPPMPDVLVPFYDSAYAQRRA